LCVEHCCKLIGGEYRLLIYSVDLRVLCDSGLERTQTYLYFCNADVNLAIICNNVVFQFLLFVLLLSVVYLTLGPTFYDRTEKVEGTSCQSRV
jgi:hypothetical protein